MSWIDDAARQAKEEDDVRALREEAFARQSQQLWGGLYHTLQEDVSRINQNQELLRRRLDETPLRIEDVEGGLKVTKITFPAIYLKVTFDGQRIHVAREIVLAREPKKANTEREQINFEMSSDYQLFMKSDKGSRLSVPVASQHLLTPLLNSHKIQEAMLRDLFPELRS
jgi:hypothetical protein